MAAGHGTTASAALQRAMHPRFSAPTAVGHRCLLRHRRRPLHLLCATTATAIRSPLIIVACRPTFGRPSCHLSTETTASRRNSPRVATEDTAFATTRTSATATKAPARARLLLLLRLLPRLRLHHPTHTKTTSSGASTTHTMPSCCPTPLRHLSHRPSLRPSLRRSRLRRRSRPSRPASAAGARQTAMAPTTRTFGTRRALRCATCGTAARRI